MPQKTQMNAGSRTKFGAFAPEIAPEAVLRQRRFHNLPPSFQTIAAQELPHLIAKICLDGDVLAAKTDRTVRRFRTSENPPDKQSAETHSIILKARRLAAPAAMFSFRLTPLAAEARGARRLARVAPTALPYLHAAWSNRSERTEAILLPDIPGQTLLRALADANEARRTALFESAARLAARVAGARLLNRDAKPSNLILDPDDSTITTIDTAAIRPILRPRAALERMLTALFLEPLGVRIHINEQHIQRAAAAALASFHSAVPDTADTLALARRVSARIERHPDPTPKDNPLDP